MRHFRVGATAFFGLCLVALLGATAVAQVAGSIEGAWKEVKVEKLGPDGWVAEDLQPGLHFFEAGYYSRMYVPTGDDGKSEPRKLFPDTDNVTDAQKAEAWGTIIANSGSYKVSESEITFNVLVAKNPNAMHGGSYKQRFEVEGDTLTLETLRDAPRPNFKITLKRLK